MIDKFIIAGPNKGRLASWKQGLKGLVRTSILTDRLDILLDDVGRIRPRIMLLDFDLVTMENENHVTQLRKLCSKTKVIVMSNALSEEIEWRLLKIGIKGYCCIDIDPSLLNQVVTAVQDGELWIRRSLTARLIDELSRSTGRNDSYRAPPGLLDKLTQREYDIALHVGNGESNKEIAESCSISERTVKAHLSEVFQKLGVSDRINLALLISESDRTQQNGFDA